MDWMFMGVPAPGQGISDKAQQARIHWSLNSAHLTVFGAGEFWTMAPTCSRPFLCIMFFLLLNVKLAFWLFFPTISRINLWFVLWLILTCLEVGGNWKMRSLGDFTHPSLGSRNILVYCDIWRWWQCLTLWCLEQCLLKVIRYWAQKGEA